MAGLYVHVPFCLKKCAYCDFYSIPYQDDLIAAYSMALLNEIKLCANDGWDSFFTIYFGGGTPSLLSPETLELCLAEMSGCYNISNDCEISLEANPGTINPTKLEGFKRAGINRLSLGVQSLNDKELALLGRIHRRSEALQAVAAINAAGFHNYSLDLIYGLPGQNLESWLTTLKQAVDLAPRHISCYLLQLDDEVPLACAIAKGQLQEACDELVAEMYYRTIDTLTGAGFNQYEISNFAKPGFECRHNIGYWRVEPYLGLGPGAVTLKTNGTLANRYINFSEINTYIELLADHKLPIREELENMQIHGLAVEAMIMGLRMTQGINIARFRGTFNLDPLEEFKTAIDWGMSQGLLQMLPPQSVTEGSPSAHLQLTRKGYFLSNEVFSRLL